MGGVNKKLICSLPSIKFILSSTLIILFNSCKDVDPNFDAEGDIKKGKIVLLNFGFAIPTPVQSLVSKQVDSLQEYYGFKFENRGCILDSALTKSADDYNKIIISHIAKNHGNNWYTRYKNSVDSLYEVAKKMDHPFNREEPDSSL